MRDREAKKYRLLASKAADIFQRLARELKAAAYKAKEAAAKYEEVSSECRTHLDKNM